MHGEQPLRRWAKDIDGTGVTVNALLPGEPVDTRMLPESDAIDRSLLLQPGMMAPPIVWLITKAANDANDRCFVAADWDPSLAPNEVTLNAGATAGWYHNTPNLIRV